MANNQSMAQILIERFGEGSPVITGAAPGRVNLIGEHTDYNDGFVLPMAIGFGIQMAARRRRDSLVQIYSQDYQETAVFSLDKPLERDAEYLWSNYVKGVIWALQETGIELPGMEIVFRGNIPQGSGLSSSAALEVVTAIVLQALAGFKLAPPELALLCQRAENDFVGAKCGIMDQFISLMGRERRALFLDCRSLAFEQIPLELGDYRILICNSGVKHSLVASEYNRRRQECSAGVAALQSCFSGIKALRDADLQQLELAREKMTPEIYRRCRHVISENNRVLESTRALRQGDLPLFGRLMNESHDSLRDDYEVSCPEIDLLVSLARKIPGVLGARITGGGFGGCTVNLVDGPAIEMFSAMVLEEYQRQTKIQPHLYISTPMEGARIL